MKVWHMSGAGNEFAVLDARGKTLDLSNLAKELCRKIGADGLMAVDKAPKADFKLHFYNSDGSRGEMCGNGARCLCKFAYDNGIAPAEMTVETDAGLIYAWRQDGETYRIKLNNPGVLDLHRLPDTAYVELGDPGIPHSVTQIPGLSWQDKTALREKALSLRHNPAFPKGVNVNFYTRLGENKVRVLTYERYVEDYTLACGTGCASVAAVLWSKGELPGGVLQAENEGGMLTVSISGTNTLQELFLEGPAKVLRIFEI